MCHHLWKVHFLEWPAILLIWSTFHLFHLCQEKCCRILMLWLCYKPLSFSSKFLYKSRHKIYSDTYKLRVLLDFSWRTKGLAPRGCFTLCMHAAWVEMGGEGSGHNFYYCPGGRGVCWGVKKGPKAAFIPNQWPLNWNFILHRCFAVVERISWTFCHGLDFLNDAA